MTTQTLNTNVTEELNAIKQELEKRQEEDFISHKKVLKIDADGNRLYLTLPNGKSYRTTSSFNRRLETLLRLDHRHIDGFLQENRGDLVVPQIEHRLNILEDKHFMIRTVGDTARALLSPSYKRVSNIDVLDAITKALQSSGIKEWKINRQITDIEKMKFQVTSPILQKEMAKVGDNVNFGFNVVNGEVGTIRILINMFAERLACTNLMTIQDDMGVSFSKIHRCSAKYINKFNPNNDFQILDKPTLEFISPDGDLNKLSQLGIIYTIKKAINEKHIENISNKIKESSNIEIGDLTIDDQVITNLKREFDLSLKEADNVLTKYKNDGDYSLYGLGNALTWNGHHVNGDRQDFFHQIGTSVMMYDKNRAKGLSQRLMSR